jgi:hypothetical protein
LLKLGATAILFFAVMGSTAQQQVQQPVQSREAPNDEAAKAAARKKLFEADKKKLEEEKPRSPIGGETEVSADQTLFFSVRHKYVSRRRS